MVAIRSRLRTKEDTADDLRYIANQIEAGILLPTGFVLNDESGTDPIREYSICFSFVYIERYGK